jgi:cell division septation protein DedD
MGMSSATMPREEAAGLEGHEFELVLGNKQLLSVFFIVVILLGIFFTMGYVVGRNSSPVDAAASRQTESYERQNAPSAMPAATKPVAVSAPETYPSAATPAATKVEPVAAQKPIELPPVTVTQPQIGQTYLQVLAVAKSEAEVLAEVLAKKGFRALVAPGPNDRVFRVLVGPARDTNDAAKLRADLEAAGFKPFVKKY